MLNLLFVSNSTKVIDLKKSLQPLVTVIIDVVPNFDHGLKAVFEKRPSMVCIQENIAGVTGEKVARHIQMLLGVTAPLFILMHEGNREAKPIKGLFDYLIDLNQAHDELVEDFQRTLKALLGEQWNKIYIPPKPVVASPQSSAVHPDESRRKAGNVPDVPVSREAAAADVTEAPQSDSAAASKKTFHVQTASEELTEMLKQQSGRGSLEIDTVKRSESPAPPPDNSDGGFELSPLPAKKIQEDKAGEVPKKRVPPARPTPVPAIQKQPPEAAPERKSADEPVFLVSTSSSTSEGNSRRSPSNAFGSQKNMARPGVEDEPVPEDLLQAFGSNYRARPFFLKPGVVVAFALFLSVAGCGWYFTVQNPRMISGLKQRLMSTVSPVASLPAPVVTRTPVKAKAAPVPAVPAPVQAVQAPVSPQPQPSLLPRTGRDIAYTTNNPGWERYVDKQYEYRIFNSSGTLKALQLLAVRNGTLSDKLISGVLKEIVGESGKQL